MNAITYSKAGGVEVFRHSTDFPIPKRENGFVLVKVLACALNPVDWKMRTSPPPLLYPKPKVAGCDVCGVVESADANSTFKKGDRVFSMLPILETQGACSDYVVIKENHVAKAPNNLNDCEVAALPLVGQTVLQAFEKGGITQSTQVDGKSILIHAGAGGVGHIAVQIAKAFGLKVFTTCSTRNLEHVKSLGADVAIDYTVEKFEDVAKNVDFVLDVMGGEYELRGLSCIKKDGTYMNIMNSGWASKIGSDKDQPDGVSATDSLVGNVTGFAYAAYRLMAQYVTGPYYKFCVVQPRSKSLQLIATLCESGKLRPVLDKAFQGYDQVKDAFKLLEGGHVRGKVTIALNTNVPKPRI